MFAGRQFAAEAAPATRGVLVCGGSTSAVEIATLLRDFGESVTVVAELVGAEEQQALGAAGIRLVRGRPSDLEVLSSAGAAEALAAIVAAPSDLATMEVAVAASASLVEGLRYAATLGDRFFSFFEGEAGEEWLGVRPSEVAGSYNFLMLLRRRRGGTWRSVKDDAPFESDERILVAAWRRLEKLG